ncbi:PREDICTED: uncharacterized protein LOC104815012 [Tarenaya hassleriana]|uniref:uncharacterized protein LOC104815012 n=1 Tax=Tarenaya hassleriana TaxID=28532 RepID=UPI00053C25AF|nr:PREDICTED: uncharacterized protein LOC104815012 [Tarenaya hassleriana]
MESSWVMNGGSTFPPATVATASPASAPPKPRNQEDTTLGRSTYPHCAQGSKFMFHGKTQEAVLRGPGSSSLSVSSNEERGNSTVAVLPWHQSQILSGDNEASHPRDACGYGKRSGYDTIGLSHYVAGTHALPMDARKNHRTEMEGANAGPVISHDVTGLHHGRRSVSDASFRAGNQSTGCSSHSNAVIHDIAPEQSSNWPLVFCLNKSGHLLLSNIGYTVILCLCHSWPMSVSDFCEHSGSSGVNPGIAVHLESGQTIAQWRKLYFQKLGTRIIEDDMGWDWPQGLSAGMVRSCASTSNKTNPSDLDTLIRSHGSFMKPPPHPAEKIFAPKLLETGPNLAETLFDRERRIREFTQSLPRALNNTLHSNFNSMSDNQILEHVACGRSSPALAVDLSAWAYSGSVLNNRSFPSSDSNLHSLCVPGKSYNNSRLPAKDTTIAERDIAFSNIELKLGQPYQKTQPLRNSSFPVASSKLLDRNVDPSNTFCSEQTVHTVATGGEKEVSEKYFHCAAGTQIFMKGKKAVQVDSENCASRTCGVPVMSQLEKLKNIGMTSSMPSMEHFSVFPEGSRSSKGAISGLSKTGYFSEATCSGSEATRSCPYNISWNLIGLERVLSVSDGNGLVISKAREDGGRSDPSVLNALPNFVAEARHQNEKSLCLHQVAPGSRVTGFWAVDSGTDGLHQPPDTRAILANLRNIPQKTGRAASFELNACTTGLSAISAYLPAWTGAVGQPPPDSVSSPSDNTPHVLRFFPASVKQEREIGSPYMLNDQMRLLAQRQISDLSKQHHEVSSAAQNQHLDDFRMPSSLNGQPSLNYSTKVIDQMHGTLLNDYQKSVGVPPPSNLSAATNISCVPERGDTPLKLTDNCSPALLSSKALLNEQEQSRDERNEITMKPVNNGKHYQRLACSCFQENCSYHAHMKQLEETGESRPRVSYGLSNQQVSSSKVHVVPSEKPFSLDQRGNLEQKSPTGIVYDSSLWKDVPMKQKVISEVKHVGWSAGELSEDRHELGEVRDAAAKHPNSSLQISTASKEQANSNISFRSPGCAVTQISVEGSNVAQLTNDFGNTGAISNPVVDEGSGIQKCCTSEDALESEESVEFMREGPSIVSKNQPSRSLLDELKLIDSLIWKKGRTQVPTVSSEMASPSKHTVRISETGKQKNVISLHTNSVKFSEAIELPPSCTLGNKEVTQLTCKKPHVDQPDMSGPVTGSDNPTFSSTKRKQFKRKLCGINNKRDIEDDYTSEPSDGVCEDPRGKMLKRTCLDSCRMYFFPGKAHGSSKKATNLNSENEFPNHRANSFCRKARPIVHGKYGELFQGKVVGDIFKPTKFLSLSRIMKTTRRCSLAGDGESGFLKKPVKNQFGGSLSKVDPFSGHRIMSKKRKAKDSPQFGMNNNDSAVEAKRLYAKCNEQSADNISKLEEDDSDETESDYNIRKREKHVKLRPKLKETRIRIRSLYELTGIEKDSTLGGNTPAKDSDCTTTVKEGKYPETTCIGRWQEPISHEANDEITTNVLESLAGCVPCALCSVCGNSDSNEMNCLLECTQCLIKVHQACYGVSKVPKSDWSCRPCKESAKNIVCVLCGYGCGAMTRALQSQTIIKSLLKVCNVDIEQENPVTLREVSTDGNNCALIPRGSVIKGVSADVLRPDSAEQSTPTLMKTDAFNHSESYDSIEGDIRHLRMLNSLIEGLTDSSVKQWVHMVCGLWMPGTRCPNVHTMSAFDVSGVSCPRPSTVCSLCNRPGGSCIKCRVRSCSIQFHPWCAHLKGLLQSEVEGDNNENVGFYGRCLYHASTVKHDSGCDPADSRMDDTREQGLTCARIEVYKGRKQDGFWHNQNGQLREKGGCLVPQEQVNAWTHINGKRSRLQELSSIPLTIVESDCRKEYLRYKEARGWRHLVVYKSGIHGLGLYTSRFISRGEMVVEYIGEIIGPRLADKREREYESGKKVQYKGACYFFRIDKENIIDATWKGGIARFVNHSCQPNCVAKVISIRNEKKVVFFAERGIYPGEEITYDYHFNHEDEGKKITCLCNSKDCRQFLN